MRRFIAAFRGRVPSTTRCRYAEKALSACIATMHACNGSLPIDKTTMQTSHAALQVNNVTMEACNATMEAYNVTVQAGNATMGLNNVAMEAYNVTMVACNAALQINKNVLTRYITRGYKNWPIFRAPNRRFWPWSRK
ncbi:MAG: hypothetical protein NT049_00525 [Planctomycetota bacterium]|nr:hypothetical protein [Planctomycetota bacterium]